jgi:hypothetical protein
MTTAIKIFDALIRDHFRNFVQDFLQNLDEF